MPKLVYGRGRIRRNISRDLEARQLIDPLAVLLAGIKFEIDNGQILEAAVLLKVLAEIAPAPLREIESSAFGLTRQYREEYRRAF